MKQVQQTVSHERGQNVTILALICDIGTHCPPVYIFPREKFRPKMSRNGPPGCLGMAHPSGWINNKIFLASLQHFVNFPKPPITNRQLLLLDNHSSHLNFYVVEYCKVNGISMLTFPPHSSHRIQPLDVSVFHLSPLWKIDSTPGINSIPGSGFPFTMSLNFSADPIFKCSPPTHYSGIQKIGNFPI